MSDIRRDIAERSLAQSRIDGRVTVEVTYCYASRKVVTTASWPAVDEPQPHPIMIANTLRRIAEAVTDA